MTEVSFLTANHPAPPPPPSQSLLKCHRNVSGEWNICIVWKIAGFTESSMKLVGSEKRKKRKRAVEKKARGPLAAVSHTDSRPSTSEATADKNAKKKDETGITSRSCLWIAVCILHI